jgi:hypothetical protein
VLPGRQRNGVEAVSCAMREHTLGWRGSLVALRQAMLLLRCQVPPLQALELVEIAKRYRTNAATAVVLQCCSRCPHCRRSMRTPGQ